MLFVFSTRPFSSHDSLSRVDPQMSRDRHGKKENYTGMRVYRLGTIRRCKGPRLIISKLRHADVQ